jgi:glycosyltransferase involved in cell wall biosynthesis
MKRVVQLITSLGRGGAEEQARRLSLGLRERGWDVTVVSLIALETAEAGLKEAGVPCCSLGMRPGIADPRGLARLAGILRRLRPAVLHSHMFHANALARVVRLICPVPVLISTLHSIAESSRISSDVGAHAPPAPFFRDLIYRLTDPMADCVVAVSDAVAERHARYGAVGRRKLRAIPNAVDTTAFRPDPELRAAARRELGVASQFVWLAAGRLMWKKDYPTLLRAFAARPASTLLIAGQGPLEAELKKLAESLGANARFLGQAADMPALLNAADAVASSSVIEGLPMALLEAAACGRPAVATDAGGARDIVIDGVTGFVTPPGDATALAAAISRVEDMPAAEREAVSRAARAHAVARFEIGAVIAQWEALYNELLQGGSPWL